MEKTKFILDRVAVKSAALARGLKQYELARMLGVASDSSMSAIIGGRLAVGRDFLRDLALVLDVPSETLVASEVPAPKRGRPAKTRVPSEEEKAIRAELAAKRAAAGRHHAYANDWTEEQEG